MLEKCSAQVLLELVCRHLRMSRLLFFDQLHHRRGEIPQTQRKVTIGLESVRWVAMLNAERSEIHR